MPKWFSKRERSSSACRLSIPSFLKKSSVGDNEAAGTLKCLAASSRTSWVVCSGVRIQSSIYHSARKKENWLEFRKLRRSFPVKRIFSPSIQSCFRTGRKCVLGGTHLAARQAVWE